MHDDAVTGRCEFLLLKDFLHLKMNVHVYIYIFLGGSKFLETALYVYISSLLFSIAPEHYSEGPEGVKWELGFAGFCPGKMGFKPTGTGIWSLGMGIKCQKWEWDK